MDIDESVKLLFDEYVSGNITSNDFVAQYWDEHGEKLLLLGRKYSGGRIDDDDLEGLITEFSAMVLPNLIWSYAEEDSTNIQKRILLNFRWFILDEMKRLNAAKRYVDKSHVTNDTDSVTNNDLLVDVSVNSVEKWLESLNDSQKDIVIRRYFLGQSISEISAGLDLPFSSISRSLESAKKTFKQGSNQ